MGEFFENLWNYLYEAYIKMDGSVEVQGSLVTIGTVVLGLYIGSLIACIVMTYNRQLLGSIVRKMISMEISTPENAKTVEELGYKKNVFVRSFFRDSEALHRVVKCVEAEEFYAEQKLEKEERDAERAKNKKIRKFKEETYRIDVDNDRFYIPEELKDVAEKRFNKKGSTWVTTLLAILVLTAVFIAIIFFLPWFMGMLA